MNAKKVLGLKRLGFLLLSAFYTGNTLLAADTEMYFGGATAGLSTKPNVLFILDTSGSMSTDVAGTGKNRMANMQEALISVLSSLTNVNVGLMRFNDPGGPILFPVKYIDEDLAIATSSESASSISSPIRQSSDDASEKGGVLDTGSNQLVLAYGASGFATVTAGISASYDDAEEDSSGGMSLTSPDLDMQSGNTNGMRFQGLTIPPAAQILSASIVFTADEVHTSDSTLRFYGEAADGSSSGAPLTYGGNANDISNRTKTSASVLWDAPDFTTTGNQYTSADLASIVQEIVNRPGWSSGNNMAFIQTHVSGQKRAAETYNSNPSQAASLSVEYAAGSVGAQTIGLRFEEIGIPQGATVTSAWIEFTSVTDSSGAMALTIQGESSDDAATYSMAALPSTRTLTTASVNWNPDNWLQDDQKQSPDLTGVVQEIVDRAGWCGNNAMAFQISGPDTITRLAQSYDGNPNQAPVLKVAYDPASVPAAGGCINQIQVYRIGDNDDDAEETVSNGSMSVGGNNFNMRSSQINGLRFPNLFLNQGANILEANLILTAGNTYSDSVTFTLKVEDNEDSAAFISADDNISNRTAASGKSVTWTPGAWIQNQEYASPDIKTLVQHVVDKATWSSGDAVTLVQTASGSDSSSRWAYTHNNSPIKAPLLRLKVQSGGASTVITKKVRDRLKEIVSDFTPGGYTPIVDTLFEAARYYRGEGVVYGRTRGDINESTVSQTTQRSFRLSHPDSYTHPSGNDLTSERNSPKNCDIDTNPNSDNCTDRYISPDPIGGTWSNASAPNYISPIADICQASYIVLLTDGEANQPHAYSSLIPGMMGSSCANISNSEECGRELAHFLSTEDQAGYAGTETVRTYTIGFNLDEGGQAGAVQFLKDIANQGLGTYNSASTADQLVGVFQNILGEILNDDTTFVSPGITVNQFNRLTHEDKIYFSLFKPGVRPKWEGNLKKYQVGHKVAGDTNSPVVVLDSNGLPAVDDLTGFFKTTARSHWSDVVDGHNVELGGSADEITGPASRKVFTFIATEPTPPNTGSTALTTRLVNTSGVPNDAVTKTMLDIASEDDTYWANLRKWAAGIDVRDEDEDGSTTDPRLSMGDPLHSVPVVVTYGGVAGAPDNTIYIATNEGLLHAVDADDGTEHFSFIPLDLLPNLKDFYNNSAANARPYGLDGSITAWVKESNLDADRDIEATDGDHVYVYVGMRRGGRNYYALDVTDRANPKYKWVIKGGTGDFAELGQTWSKPLLTKMMVGSAATVPTDVLIFAGGYDEDQDTASVRTADDTGRAIFIVNADTGQLIWSGGPSGGGHDEIFTDMLYSIPSDIRGIDVNGDKLVDRLYVGDMGGQIWRFDIQNRSDVADLVTGGVIAQISGTDAANNRRFFYEPDASLVRGTTGTFIALSVGSGWRAHPLDMVVNDRFYMIRDQHVYYKPTTYTKITESDLYDATDNLIGEGTDKAAEATKLAEKAGWFIQLENPGEKALAEAVTINSQVLFTTVEPSAAGAGCSAGAGLGRLYVVSVADATPTIHFGSGSTDPLTKIDRTKTLLRGGIPPSPTVLMLPEPTILVGPESIDGIEAGPLTDYTGWVEQKN